MIDKTTKKELDLGTEYNAVPFETDNATFIDAENVSEEAKINRNILRESMQIVGFVCYPSEWWHWSYGDKYWAYSKNMQHAFYSAIVEENIEKHL